jgi:hypothetical protein
MSGGGTWPMQLVAFSGRQLVADADFINPIVGRHRARPRPPATDAARCAVPGPGSLAAETDMRCRQPKCRDGAVAITDVIIISPSLASLAAETQIG